MCTNPIQVTRRYPTGKSRVDIVPCGKCHECLAKKQNEFAALCIQEAKAAKSMYLFTFTYDNEHLPIMASMLSARGERVGLGFVPPAEHSDCIDDMKDTRSVVHPVVGANDVEYCPSLCREDLRLFIKRFRVAYKRKFGRDIDCRFAAFGEYGDATHRPHYHAIFLDLDASQASFMRELYSKQYGFCDCREVKRVNPDGSPGFVRAAKYIAKYVSKDKRDYRPLLDGLCEAPRRICSLGFGLRDLPIETLKSFTHVPR